MVIFLCNQAFNTKNKNDYEQNKNRNILYLAAGVR